MKVFGRIILASAALATASFAQQWEFGGVAGGGFLSTTNVSNTLGSATAGFQSGAAFGAFIGFNSYRHLGGEIHYNYLQGELKLSSGGSTASFGGQSHVIHYDVILHTNNNNKAQLFLAIGGGMKLFRGTGVEALVGQPVYLDLRVKVLANWRRNARSMQRFGYRLAEGRSK